MCSSTLIGLCHPRHNEALFGPKIVLPSMGNQSGRTFVVRCVAYD